MKRKAYNNRMPAGWLAAALMLIFTVIPQAAFAGGNIPVSIDIPLTYIVSGNDKMAGGDTVTLTPDDPLAPMPADSSDGKKTIKITKEGTYSFGEIYYDRPEVWWYTIKRNVTEKKGVTKDSSIYKAKVIALNDGHGYVLVYREGSNEKQELVYRDSVAPDTGDAGGLLIYIALMSAALTGFALTVMLRHRKRRRTQHRA